MRRVRKETTLTEQGWTRWVRPVMHNYIMVCCDCGLAHRMQFKVGLVSSGNPRTGAYRLRLLPDSEFRVMFRAQRAPRYTAMARRKKHPVEVREIKPRRRR